MGVGLKLLRTIQKELNNTSVSLATLGLLVSTLEYPDIDIDEELAAKYPYKRAFLPVARLDDGTLWNW